MRPDMHKVICECYRHSPWSGRSYHEFRQYFKHGGEDEIPNKVPMRFYKVRKDFGENLRPLKQYLYSKVGQPWDEVYSELKKGLPKGILGQHVLEHVWGWVDKLDARKLGYYPYHDFVIRDGVLVDTRHPSIATNFAPWWSKKQGYTQKHDSPIRAEQRFIKGKREWIAQYEGIWFVLNTEVISKVNNNSISYNEWRYTNKDQYFWWASNDKEFVCAQTSRHMTHKEMRKLGLKNQIAYPKTVLIPKHKDTEHELY